MSRRCDLKGPFGVVFREHGRIGREQRQSHEVSPSPSPSPQVPKVSPTPKAIAGPESP
jgi:hypothetical protein